mmetsp:Transcript_9003/g.19301  ORF Transcript_9003/g.19301 Transcript_9003/m.19301 type:complete len:85 (-) Transcript_9003:1690-1944(-)
MLWFSITITPYLHFSAALTITFDGNGTIVDKCKCLTATPAALNDLLALSDSSVQIPDVINTKSVPSDKTRTTPNFIGVENKRGT